MVVLQTTRKVNPLSNVSILYTYERRALVHTKFKIITVSNLSVNYMVWLVKWLWTHLESILVTFLVKNSSTPSSTLPIRPFCSPSWETMLVAQPCKPNRCDINLLIYIQHVSLDWRHCDKGHGKDKTDGNRALYSTRTEVKCRNKGRKKPKWEMPYKPKTCWRTEAEWVLSWKHLGT